MLLSLCLISFGWPRNCLRCCWSDVYDALADVVQEPVQDGPAADGLDVFQEPVQDGPAAAGLDAAAAAGIEAVVKDASG